MVNTNIKAVVWDFGGVFSTSPFEAFNVYEAERGLPTFVCGPGSMAEQGHKADEYLALPQLLACTQMLDRLISQMSG